MKPRFTVQQRMLACLYFDIDQTRGIAAAAVLLVDKQGVSHQWLTRGNLGLDNVALIMDPHNPEYTKRGSRDRRRSGLARRRRIPKRLFTVDGVVAV